MLTSSLIYNALFMNLNMFGLTNAYYSVLHDTALAGTPPRPMQTSVLAATANSSFQGVRPSSVLAAKPHQTFETDTSPLTATANLAGHYGVSGYIRFALQSNNAVAVSISVNGLNALNSSLAYAYHIHTDPISSDGNCASALGHLDPLLVTDGLICNPRFAQYCQEGDLSGRHGKLSGFNETSDLSYVDDYLRFWPQPFSILGRSVVVHLPNSTRIACGNITSTVDGTETEEASPTFLSSNYTTQCPSKPPPAPRAKYDPFNGSTPDAAILSHITLPSTLPTVKMLPNVLLGTNVTTQTVNGKEEPLTLPAAINARTHFTYTPGAALPTQNGTTGANSTSVPTSCGINNVHVDAKKWASDGARHWSPSTIFCKYFVVACVSISSYHLFC